MKLLNCKKENTLSYSFSNIFIKILNSIVKPFRTFKVQFLLSVFIFVVGFSHQLKSFAQENNQSFCTSTVNFTKVLEQKQNDLFVIEVKPVLFIDKEKDKFILLQKTVIFNNITNKIEIWLSDDTDSCLINIQENVDLNKGFI